MRRISAPLLLAILFTTFAPSQTSTPRPPNTPPLPGESSSQQQQQQVQPPSVPLPDDALMPNLGTLPDTEGKKESGVKRKLQELMPHCPDIS